MLLIGFHRGTQPVVCKFTLEDADVLHEHQVLKYLLSVHALTGIVKPVELVTFKSGAQVAAPNGKSINTVEKNDSGVPCKSMSDLLKSCCFTCCC